MPGSGPTGTGISTAPQTATLFASPGFPDVPRVTATFSYSNQQFTATEGNPEVPGMVFGATSSFSGNEAAPYRLFDRLAGISAPANDLFTACNACPVGTGIDVNENQGVSLFNATDAFIDANGNSAIPFDVRTYMGDLTITFSRPVNNPIVHLSGLGGFYLYSTEIPQGSDNVLNYMVGFTTEWELADPSLSLTRKSGNTALTVTPTQIQNSFESYGGSSTPTSILGVNRSAASGSVLINGFGLSSVTFRVHVKGDRGSIRDNTGNVAAATFGNEIQWSSQLNHQPNGTPKSLNAFVGDLYSASVSLESCQAINNPSPAQIICQGDDGNDITVKTDLNAINSVRFVRFPTDQVAGEIPTAAERAAIYAAPTVATSSPGGGFIEPFEATLTAADAGWDQLSPGTYYLYAIVNPDPGPDCRNLQEVVVDIIECDPPAITLNASVSQCACIGGVNPVDANIVVTNGAIALTTLTIDGPSCPLIFLDVAPGAVIETSCPITFSPAFFLATGTDEFGQTVSASFLLPASGDRTPPDLGPTPPSTTVQCTDIPDPPPDVTATDNCDTNVTITLSETATPGTCEGETTIVRTWIASDDCGNQTARSQTLTVIDSVPPVFGPTPSDETVNCGDIPFPPTVTATDACDPVVDVLLAEDILPGSCTTESVLVRVWTAADDCGNTASWTQRITVVDTIAPVLRSPPENTTVTCGNVPNPPPVGATDNCSLSVDVVLTETTLPGSCAAESIIVRVWTATDTCGNASSRTQQITIVDNLDPVIDETPADATVTCDGIPLPPDVSAIDNCDGTVEVLFTEEILPGSCSEASIIRRIWTATDACGNGASRSQVLTVLDNRPPVLGATPPNATFPCGEVPPPPDVTAIDNCATNVPVDFAEKILPGDCADESTIERVWTATDPCGNSVSRTQTITVVDNVPPVLGETPPDVTVICTALPTRAPITAMDNCDPNVSIAFAEQITPGTCSAESVVERVWTATDACGNSVSRTQTITVVDTASPVLSAAPPDATVNCGEVPDRVMLTATDNCDAAIPVVFSQRLLPGGCAGAVIERAWTATDECGNQSSYTQRITVVDNVPPVLSAIPPNTSFPCTNIPDPEPVTATDNCGAPVAVVFAESITPDPDLGKLTIERVWTAADPCGNRISATQTIDVVDTTDPVLGEIPPDATVPCDDIPAAPVVTAADTCDTNVAVTLSETSAPGACPSASILERVWTATDDCGNSVSQTQTLTVVDFSPPVLSETPPDVTVPCGEAPAPPRITASDTCDPDVPVEFAETAADLSVQRVWTAVDACGNTTTHTQFITFIDQEVLIACPADATVPVGTDISDPFAFGVPSGRSCDVGEFDFTDTIVPDCGDATVVLRVWTMTVPGGVSASCTQTITFIDTVAPTLSETPLSTTTSCDFIPDVTTVTATDDSGADVPVTFSETTTPGGCANEFILQRVWTAADTCGNSVGHTQFINVVDISPPVLGGQTPVMVIGGKDCAYTIPEFPIRARENCDPDLTLVQEPPPGTVIFGPGTRVVEVIARDACGNESRFAIRVDVMCFDLALSEKPRSRGPFKPGDEVTFDIRVENQGTIAAQNIVLTDYIPRGLTLNDSAWSGNPATITLPGPLPAGLATSVSITFTVDVDSPESIVNLVEISSAEGPDGAPGIDADSTPDNIPDNDAGGSPGTSSDGATRGNGTGTPGDTDPSTDEDDHDPASIETLPAFTSLGDIVWFDRNNSGLRNIGEAGLPGIRLVLWTADGDGSPAVPVATNFTDLSGNYLFDLVPPGEYIVQVPDQPILVGFASSTGNGPAPDPDDNFNDDDNGDPVPGLGTLSKPITLGVGTKPTADGGPTDGSVSEDSGNNTLDFGFYEPSFDLVLTKTVSGDATFLPGEAVTFTIEVFNRGRIAATDILVTDTFPQGLIPADAAWTTIDGTASRIIPGPLSAGDSVELPITFTLAADAPAAPLTNQAAISSAERADAVPGGDFNEANDSDSATIEVLELQGFDTRVFDLALRQRKMPLGPVSAGDSVRFEIDVINQGTIEARNIRLVHTFPAGLTLADSDWSLTPLPDARGVPPSGAAFRLVPGPLAPGASETISITYDIDPDAAGLLTTVVEISGAQDADGDPALDVDSVLDENPDNDGTSINDDITNPLDEDDHDTETFEVLPLVFDLALLMVPPSGEFFLPGADVTFTLSVINQGERPARNIQLTDYIPTGLALNDPDWAEGPGTASRTIAGPLAPGDSTNVRITFTVFPDVADGDLFNVAEISAAQGSDGQPAQDVDSIFDAAPDNDGLTDPLEGPPTEDDFDVAAITVFTPITSVGHTVWLDANNNGTLDAGEAGIDGVTLVLWTADAVGDPIIPIATNQTDASGGYLFDELPPRDYILQIPDQSSLAGLTTSTGNGPAPDSDNDIENDDNGIASEAGTLSAAFTLSVGGEPTGEEGPEGTAPDASGNNTIDFGFTPVREPAVRIVSRAGTAANGATFTTSPGKVTLTFDITNTGNTPLSGMSILIDNGTPIDPADDTVLTAADCQGLAGPLAPGAATECSIGLSITAERLNTILATITANPTDATGADLLGESEVTNDDDADVLIQTLSLGSTVFLDLNDNGTQDANETGIPGVFLEALDAKGSVVGFGTTGGDGNYIIGGLPEGPYTLRILEPPSSAPQSSTLSNSADDQTDGDDNGIQEDGSGTQVTSGLIELRIGDEPVDAETAPGGTLDDANDANADMTIDFGFVPPSNPGIRVVKTILAGHVDSTACPGSDPFSGVNGTPITYCFELTNTGNLPLSNVIVTDTDLDPDFIFNIGPMAPSEAVTVSRLSVINGDLRNNVTVSGEPAGPDGTPLGLPPVTDTDRADVEEVSPAVRLEKNLLSASSNGDGSFVITFGFLISNIGDSPLEGLILTDDIRTQFANVSPASFQAFSDGLSPNPDWDGLAESNILSPGQSLPAGQFGDISIRFTVTPGANPLARDSSASVSASVAGGLIVQDTTSASLTFLSLGDLVWFDLDNDGAFESGEPPVANVLLRLLDPSDAFVQSTTSDASGRYVFDFIQEGSYSILVDPSNFEPGGPLENAFSSAITEADPNANLDRNDNGLDDPDFAQNGIRSGIIQLSFGEEPRGESTASNSGSSPDDSSNLTLDFGFFRPAIIEGSVWTDLNNDGAPNENLLQEGLIDATVNLFEVRDGTASLVATLLTGPQGAYRFDNLTAGDYRLEIDRNTISELLVTPTTPLEYSISLAPGESFNEGNFGFTPTPTAITLSSFTAKQTEAGVLLEWSTSFEANTLGFVVHRLRANGNAIPVSDLIPGGQGSYAFTEPGAVGGRFVLAELATDFQRNIQTPIVIPTIQVPPVEGTPGQLIVGDAPVTVTMAADIDNLLVTGVSPSHEILDVTNPDRPLLLGGQHLNTEAGAALYFSVPAGTELLIRNPAVQPTE